MWVPPGLMLGKGCMQSREHRCVGGELGPGSTPGHQTTTYGGSVGCVHRTAPVHQHYPTPPNGGVVGGLQFQHHCQSTAAATEANPGTFGGLYGCSGPLKNKSGRKNKFGKKRGAYWGSTVQIPLPCRALLQLWKQTWVPFGGLFGCS